MTRRISIGQQIEEVRRELHLRADVYPRQVAAGKLRASEAEYHLERMRAALRTLEWVRDNEDRLREAFRVLGGEFVERPR